MWNGPQNATYYAIWLWHCNESTLTIDQAQIV
uniref:Uncharacterized protein n=1 Tax=Rhizophora mucronata TaxID=61149 RepID=A0A2P2PBP3_RHIMU